MAEHNEFGREGEETAVTYLLDKGYRILQRNYHHQKAEIDIIAQLDDVLAVVEVRTRSSDRVIPIADTITPKKIRHLVNAANAYVRSHGLDLEVRFDVITILKNPGVLKIEHLKDAFYHF